MDDDVAPILPIRSPLPGALPREHDDVDVRVGGAEDLGLSFDDDSARAEVSRGDLVGGGVDEDLINPAVELVFNSQEGKSGLRRDRYLHLVRDVETIHAAPYLIVHDDAGDGEQVFFFFLIKPLVEGQRLDPGQPVGGEVPSYIRGGVSPRVADEGRELPQ